jgi:hypothetical protein
VIDLCHYHDRIPNTDSKNAMQSAATHSCRGKSLHAPGSTIPESILLRNARALACAKPKRLRFGEGKGYAVRKTMTPG